MRFLLEILIVGAVIAAGWHQSYRQHYQSIFTDPSARQRVGPAAAAAPYPGQPTVPGPAGVQRGPAWMWDENKMDKPYPANGRVNR